MAEHLSYLSLLDLVQGQLDGTHAGHAFGHLGFCGECAARLRGVREIRSEFDTSWAQFQFFDRAKDDGSGREVHLTLRATVDRLRKHARIVIESLFPDEGSGVAAWEVPIPGGAGAGGQEEGTAEAELQFVSPHLGTATVVAEAGQQSISVLLRPPEGVDPDTLLVERAPRLLLRAPDGSWVHEAEFVLVEGARYLLAEVRDLPGTRWIVSIEAR